MISPSEHEKNQIIERLLHIKSDSEAVSWTSSKAYFRRYQSIFCPDEANDAVIQIDRPTLRTHLDVLTFAKSLCDNHALSRGEMTRKWFASRATTAAEMEHISRAVVNIAFMIDCNERDYYPKGFDCSIPRAKWERDQSFLNFLETSFLPLQQRANAGVTLGDKASLKAWKLASRYGIRIRGTDNLLEHLLYDPRHRTLMIFHHVSYLRFHLRCSSNESLDMGFAESLAL